MSVLVPDLKVYNYLQAGIEKMAYTTTIADFWADSIKNHFRNCPDIGKEAKRLVLSWLSLNEESYNQKYKETGSLIPFYYETFTHKKLTAIQTLKYLQCVYYNIEIKPETEESKKDLKLLENCIIDLSQSIISNLQEYKESTWCE